jgi:hypothetical protein
VIHNVMANLINGVLGTCIDSKKLQKVRQFL